MNAVQFGQDKTVYKLSACTVFKQGDRTDEISIKQEHDETFRPYLNVSKSLRASSCLPTYLPTYLRLTGPKTSSIYTYLPTYLPIYLHTYLPIYLPTYC